MSGDSPELERPPRLVLASASPRRLEMLRAEGVDALVRPAPVDDGELVPHGEPGRWVVAMAYLKARAARDALARDAADDARDLPVLAADTVCAVDGRVLGKPADEDDARATLRALVGRTHVTLTGVCLLPSAADAASGARRPNERLAFLDATEVEVGEIEAKELERYVQSGAWRGKAGGYNLTERLAAGWPIECRGDPATVVGLPMNRLRPILRRLATGSSGTTSREGDRPARPFAVPRSWEVPS